MALSMRWLAWSLLSLFVSRVAALRVGQGQSSGLQRTKDTESIPQFVYTVGVEGSNHHGVMSELLVPLALSNVHHHHHQVEAKSGDGMSWCSRAHNETSPFEMFLANQGKCDAVPPPGINPNKVESSSPRFCARDNDARQVLFHGDIKVDQLISRTSQCGGLVLEDNSFPSGGARTPPAPINLKDLYEKGSPHINIQLVVLQRNFYDTVLSHGNWDGGPLGHAEKMAEYMQYIAQNLEGIPPDAWRILPVDCIPGSKHLLQERLAQFLGFQSESCPHCWEHWRDPSNHALENRNVVVDNVFASNAHRFKMLDRGNANSFSKQYLVEPTTCQ